MNGGDGARALYLSRSWTDNRDRCQAAHIPDDRAFATKNDLALDMIERAARAAQSAGPCGWTLLA